MKLIKYLLEKLNHIKILPLI